MDLARIFSKQYSKAACKMTTGDLQRRGKVGRHILAELEVCFDVAAMYDKVSNEKNFVIFCHLLGLCGRFWRGPGRQNP